VQLLNQIMCFHKPCIFQAYCKSTATRTGQQSALNATVCSYLIAFVGIPYIPLLCLVVNPLWDLSPWSGNDTTHKYLYRRCVTTPWLEWSWDDLQINPTTNWNKTSPPTAYLIKFDCPPPLKTQRLTPRTPHTAKSRADTRPITQFQGS